MSNKPWVWRIPGYELPLKSFCIPTVERPANILTRFQEALSYITAAATLISGLYDIFYFIQAMKSSKLQKAQLKHEMSSLQMQLANVKRGLTQLLRNIGTGNLQAARSSLMRVIISNQTLMRSVNDSLKNFGELVKLQHQYSEQLWKNFLSDLA